MYEEFYNNPIIQKLAQEKRWTISDNNKVPIDMTDLLLSNGRAIHGALTKKEGHNPFVDLNTLMYYLPNAKNNAFSLDAKTDGVMVLDIEPKCPKAIADKLLQLPAYYGEFSMSGKGYHLILPVPKEYEEVYSCSVAVKEEHGYYEFLCNHCVTFTRNIIPAGYVPNIGQGSYQDYVDLWCELASKVDLNKKDISLDVLSEEEETKWTDYIQKILQSEAKAYKKEPSDFEDDMSRYEHGYTGHVYYVLLNVLKSLKVFYTKSEMIWEVYRATSELIPYRDKHDTIHDGMPWLLYQSAVIVNKNYDEDEIHAMTDKYSENPSSRSAAAIIKGDDDEFSSEDEFLSENEFLSEDDMDESYTEDSSAYNSGCDVVYDDVDENNNEITEKPHHFNYEDYEEDSSVYNTEYQYSED